MSVIGAWGDAKVQFGGTVVVIILIWLVLLLYGSTLIHLCVEIYTAYYMR